MPRSSFLTSVVAAAALVAAGPVAAASAAVVDAGSAPVDETYVAATCVGPDGSEFDIVQRDLGTESWSANLREPVTMWGGLVDVTSTSDLSSTYTNSETGLSWTSTFRTRVEDVRILASAGTKTTVLRAFTGHFTGFASDGSAIDRQDSRIEFVVVVDSRGTADPDDDTESFVEVVKGVGRSTVGDICEVALTWTFPAT
jgi:hypothetical protein